MVFDKSDAWSAAPPLIEAFNCCTAQRTLQKVKIPSMADQAYSIVVRNGAVVLPEGVVRRDVGIRDETIAAIGAKSLAQASRKLMPLTESFAPGGVDPHAHIEDRYRGGGRLLNADTFESATTSAVFGGTTTVISFAAQHVGHALDPRPCRLSLQSRSIGAPSSTTHSI